jgi:hypothetical protein
MRRRRRVHRAAPGGTPLPCLVPARVLATNAPINRREFRQWDTEDVKRCDESVS